MGLLPAARQLLSLRASPARDALASRRPESMASGSVGLGCGGMQLQARGPKHTIHTWTLVAYMLIYIHGLFSIKNLGLCTRMPVRPVTRAHSVQPTW